MPDTSTPALTASNPLTAALRAAEANPAIVRDYVAQALDRIQAIDLRLRSLAPEPDRRARLEADATALLDRSERAREQPALLGALLGVKDIVAVDGLPTRAGTALPSTLFEMPEATVVRRFRDAGALVLGKTVTTEFAYFEPGATVNPHDPTRTPGGSSSGSAAAVAAGLATVAIGTQTVGSVIRPAAFCGVVGYKPTFGRIPTDGVIAYSRSVDHVGLFTQDAAGMALAAAAVVDAWRAEASRLAEDARPVLGVPEGAYLDQVEPAAREAFEGQLARLEAAGCTVRRVRTLDDVDAINSRHRDVATFEFAERHREWFDAYASLYRPRTALLVEAGRAISPQAAEAGRESRGRLRADLERLMDEHRLDLWAMPAATGPAPVGLGSTGNPAMNMPWTHSGLPAVTLPAGTLEGMPLGLQLAARSAADETLLAWAELIEPLLAPAEG